MIAYRYIKRFKKEPRSAGGWPRYLSAAAFVLGLIFILSAAGPILLYEFFTAPRFRSAELITPTISRDEAVLGQNVTAEPDLTRASTWFPTAPVLAEVPTKITSYTLSIPKLKIYDGTVRIGGEDLSKSLIHYKGTALPGQPGNAVIFGHSVLPQFFDPKNYLTIFSLLPQMGAGDEFFISYDGIEYRYVVEDIIEVSPTDFTVLEQRFDDSFATLITCVPPGLKTRRLAVRGRLVNNPAGMTRVGR